MPTTTNPTLTTDWSEIVDDAIADFFLSVPTPSGALPVVIEVLAWAETDDAENIDVQGHHLRGDRIESINRGVLGEGYVYARCLDGPVTVIVST